MNTKSPDSLAHLFNVRTESTEVDFKGHFNVGDEGNWLEIIKDIIAMANSGRGVILFGLNDQGMPTNMDCQPLLSFDTSRITAKIRSWTYTDFVELKLEPLDRDGVQIAALSVGGVATPIGFTKDGQYSVDGKIKFAFRAGQFFFRHGAKSEPGSSNDVRECIERRLSIIREQWLGNIQKVVEAPEGAAVKIVTSSDTQNAFRLTEDTSAASGILIHCDDSHPLRQCDVIRRINERLGNGIKINQAHIQDIRRVHLIEEKPHFFHKGRIPGAPKQYSESFVDWIVENFSRDSDFFNKAREARKIVALARNDVRVEKLKKQEPVATTL